METFKFGNKVKCIIRFHNCSQTIGGITPLCDDQPYTVLNDISAEVDFKQNITNSTSKEKGYLLSTNVSEINEIKLKNCLLTNKIMALIFEKGRAQNFIHQCQVTTDPGGGMYLPTTQGSTVLRAFIYNSEGEFVAAYGNPKCTNYETAKRFLRMPQGGPLPETDPGDDEGKSGELFYLTCYDCIFPANGKSHGFGNYTDYKIFYEVEGNNTFSLDSCYAPVMSFDLISEGNLEDSTRSFCLHIAKASISPDKVFRFSDGESNTIDLTLKVIQPLPDEIKAGKTNYLTIC